MPPQSCPYVSRGGLKLATALKAFALDIDGLACADLGCHVGGFSDCLLKHGARHVFAVDSAYGTLAWKLRQDPRVSVLERTNVLHFDPQSIERFTGCDLVCLDLGWTRQAWAIPAALGWLRPEGRRRIITLIKPHYEVRPDVVRATRGILTRNQAECVRDEVIASLPKLGVRVSQWVESPIRGGSNRRRNGNIEFLALLSEDRPR